LAAVEREFMSWTAVVVTGEVDADYSQFELDLGDGGRVPGFTTAVGLATSNGEEHVVLIVARQYGAIAVEVQVLDAEPPVYQWWDAAVEFSVHTGVSRSSRSDGVPVWIYGFAGAGAFSVPVPADVDARVRYVVLDGQVAKDQTVQGDGPGPDRYLLQMWPAVPSPARIVAATSPWSQYWAFGMAAYELLVELAEVPDPGRLIDVIDRALADRPDVAERLRAGDQRYRSGINRYIQQLFSLTFNSSVYSDVRHDHDRIGRLIDDRARLLGE
jgi:hypothetical protein